MSEEASSDNNKSRSDPTQEQEVKQENVQQPIKENENENKTTAPIEENKNNEENKINEEKTSTKTEEQSTDDKQENVQITKEKPELILNEKEENEFDDHKKEEKDHQNPTQTETLSPAPVKKFNFIQDIRYSCENIERDKVIEKFSKYEFSSVYACSIRFLIFTPQQKKLFGYRHQDINGSFTELGNNFGVKIYPGYQSFHKQSYKIFGTETNVQKCLQDILSKLFVNDRQYQRENRYNELDRSRTTNDEEKQLQSTAPTQSTTVTKDDSLITSLDATSPSVEPSVKQSQLKSEEKTTDDTKSIQQHAFVTTLSSDESIQEQIIVSGKEQPEQQVEVGETKSEEIKPTNEQSQEKTSEEKIPSTENINSTLTSDEQKEKSSHVDNSEIKQTISERREEIPQYHPVEKKTSMTFTYLLLKEVVDLWKRSSYFIGILQQRLNVTIQRPGPKFGERQYELQITGDTIDSIADTCIRITAFLQHELGQEPEIYKDHPNPNVKTPASSGDQQDKIMSEDEPHLSTSVFPQRLTNNYNRYEQSHQQRSEVRFHTDQNRTGYPFQQQPPFSNSVYEQQPQQQRRFDYNNAQQQFHPSSQQYQHQQHLHESQQQIYHPSQQHQRGYQQQQFDTAILIRTECVARVIGKGGVNLKYIHNRCHLHNIEVEPKDPSRRKEYIRCDLSGDQHSITDAILMIRDMLKRDGPDAVKELPDFHPHRFTEQQFNEQQQYYSLSPEYSTQLPPSHFQASSNNPFATPYISHIYRTDLTAKPLDFSSNSQTQPQQQQGSSYTFNKNNLNKTNGQIPQFDFVHQPTSGKKDKRQSESFEFVGLSSTGNQDSYELQHQQSSLSNSSSTSPHHKTKRSCPETKEIPTGTDEGYWISQVHLVQLNEHDRQEFQNILNKIEKIKIEEDKMKSKPHQQPHSSSYRLRKQNYPTQVFHRQRAQTTIPSSNGFDFNLKQHNQPQHFDILTSEDNQNKSIQKTGDLVTSSTPSSSVVEQLSSNVNTTSNDENVNKQQEQKSTTLKQDEGEKATGE